MTSFLRRFVRRISFSKMVWAGARLASGGAGTHRPVSSSCFTWHARKNLFLPRKNFKKFKKYVFSFLTARIFFQVFSLFVFLWIPEFLIFNF
jgi:hypothetical protein